MTLDEANNYLELLGESILSLENMKYVAVVEDEYDYSLEIGYKEFSRPQHRNINNVIFQNPLIDSMSIKSKELILEISKRDDYERIGGIKLKGSEGDFEYLNGNKIESGTRIRHRTSGLEQGSLGAIIKLKNSPNNYYFISNWHVIATSIGVLGSEILEYSTQKKIGELYWAVNNSFYDLAIGKITIPNFTFKGKIINSLKKSDEIFKNMNLVVNGELKKGAVYSNNAFVKIPSKNRIYKNQILTKKISTNGDSGSLAMSEDDSIVGLIFSGDNNQFSVANHLYKVFTNKIPEYRYSNSNSYSAMMPEIEFSHMIK